MWLIKYVSNVSVALAFFLIEDKQDRARRPSVALLKGIAWCSLLLSGTPTST